MKKILGMLLLVLSFNVNALDSNSVSSAGFSNLSDTQKAEVIQLVAQKAAINNGKGITSVESANEWLNIGERIGKGFAGAAKELGIAANQFADTPVGKWVAFLIIWHFFGAMAVHIGFALLALVVGIFATRYAVNRMRDTKITYDLTKTNWFGNHPLASVEHTKLNEGGVFIMLLCYATTIIVTSTTAFNGW